MHALHRLGRTTTLAFGISVFCAGCGDPGGSVTAPPGVADDREFVDPGIHSPALTLEKLEDAYNERNARALQLLYHGKYRFDVSVEDVELPAQLRRSEVLQSATTMFQQEDVLDVSLTVEVGDLSSHTDRRLVVVDAVVNLEVTVSDVFGPPIVYHVDHHPAQFVLAPRGRGNWAIVRHTDLFEAEGERPATLERTWGQVLDQFMQI